MVRQSILKQDYKEDMSLEEAEGLAVKVLSKTMDSAKLTSEKVRRLPRIRTSPALALDRVR